MQQMLIADRYRITDRVSEDGIGVSYHAVDERNNQAVVIKILHERFKQQTPENFLRFKRDIAKLSKNRHPNIIPIYDTGGDGAAYVVQEDIENGSALSSQTGKLSNLDTVADIILQISAGLESAHQQDVLHRMINPWDIIVTKRDTGVSAGLTGFGAGLLIDLAGIKEAEEIVRIFGYMSPETTGILRKPVDNRSDLYSLGIVFYQLATGRLPYDGKDISTLIHQHIAQKPTPPKELNPSVSSVMDRIILRLMAKDPLDRYQTAAGLIADLKEYRRQRAEGKVPEFEIARRDRAAHLTFTTRLIGRDKELGMLQGLIARAKQGQGGLALVYGPPGVGKSRLIDELRGYIHSIGGIFVGGKCYQYESTTPFDVFTESLDAYVRKLKRKGKEEQNAAVARMKEAVGLLGGEVLKIVPAIVDLIGPQPDLEALETEKERLRFMLTVSGFLLSLGSGQNPFVIFLDDIQWADEGNIELLSKVAEGVSNRPIVIIAGYRDTEIPEGHTWVSTLKMMKEKEIPVFDIPVKPFTLAGATRVISEILMEDEGSVLPLARILHERTEGNAFFVLELLHSLVDQGLIYFQDDHYRYDLKKLGASALPANVIDVVVKRIDRISEERQKILAYSALMGSEIEFERISDLAGIPREKVVDAIEEGVRNQLLTRDITGRENVVFMHDRIREALYKLISEEEKVALHVQIARFLEERNKDNPEPVLFELAYHFSQAYVSQADIQKKTLTYSLQAARKAQAAYANDQAIRLYSVVTKILEDQDKTMVPEYLDAMKNLGLVYHQAGKYDKAVRTLTICESLVPKGENVRKAQILSIIGDTEQRRGDLKRCVEVNKQALGLLGVRLPGNNFFAVLGILKQLFIQGLHSWVPGIFVRKDYSNDPKAAIIADIFYRFMFVYYFTDLITCIYVAYRGFNTAQRTLGPCRLTAKWYSVISMIWSQIPWRRLGRRDNAVALKMAGDLNDRAAMGVACFYRCMIERPVDPVVSKEYAQKTVDSLKGVGEYWDLTAAFVFLGWNNLMLDGRFADQMGLAEECISVGKAINAPQNIGFGLGFKGQLLSYIGNESLKNDAVEILKEAISDFEKVGDKPWTLLATAYLAYAHLRIKSYAEALPLAEWCNKHYLTHNNLAWWTLDFLGLCAEVCLQTIADKPDLTDSERTRCMKTAKSLCRKAFWYGKLSPTYRGWSYQVNGTYQWLMGDKKKAIGTWERGVAYLREHTKDTYRLASILLEEASFLLKDNPKDKKAQEYLIEVREIFTHVGAKLDLKRTDELLKSISPEGEVIGTRQALTITRHLESLLSVIRAIGSIFVLEDLLEKIVEQAMKVTGAERGFLLLYDEKDKTLRQKVSQGIDETLAALPFSYENYKLSLNMVQEAEKTGKGLFAGEGSKTYPLISGDLKEYAVREAMCVPLKAKEKALGMIYLDNRMASGMFGQEELELMTSFAVQASISIENAHLVGNLVEQERLKQEMELGRQIQLSLLPHSTPALKGYKIGGLMNPAQEIGGDYYDFVPISGNGDGGKLGIVIADVSGKGVDAGMVMAITKSLIHSLSGQNMTTREMVLKLNKHLCNLLRRQKFVSLIYAECTADNNEFHWSGAGHEYVLVLRNSGTHEVEEIMTGGVVLGVFDRIEKDISEKIVSLQSGDKIILYTDGVTEAKNADESLFTRQRLVETLRQSPTLSAQELLLYLNQKIKEHIGDAPQYDDVTLVVIEKE